MVELRLTVRFGFFCERGSCSVSQAASSEFCSAVPVGLAPGPVCRRVNSPLLPPFTLPAFVWDSCLIPPQNRLPPPVFTVDLRLPVSKCSLRWCYRRPTKAIVSLAAFVSLLRQFDRYQGKNFSIKDALSLKLS